MAGLGFAAIGDFAFDGDIVEVFGEKIADARGEFRHGDGVAVGVGVELELGGHAGTPTPAIFARVASTGGRSLVFSKQFSFLDTAGDVEVPEQRFLKIEMGYTPRVLCRRAQTAERKADGLQSCAKR